MTYYSLDPFFCKRVNVNIKYLLLKIKLNLNCSNELMIKLCFLNCN